MEAIFLPIGIGIAIGLVLFLAGVAILLALFIVGMLLTPIYCIVRAHTLAGRVRWEAKKRAFHELCAAPRGTPERRAALERYRAI